MSPRIRSISQPGEPVDGAKVIIEGKVKLPRNPLIVTGEYLIRALMGIRSLSLTYTSSRENFFQVIFRGSKISSGCLNPVVNLPRDGRFVLGMADKRFFDKALANGWLSKDTLINTPASYNSSNSISLRSLIEPFPGLRIDLSADRRYLEAINSNYTADRNGNFPDSTRNRMTSGNYCHFYNPMGNRL